MLKKIISGGQSGIDQIGLICARMCNIPTGGTAPKGYRTEHGSKYELRDLYDLKESHDWRYGPRTEKNVMDADATILFGDMNSAGSKMTLMYIHNHKKPYLTNPTSNELVDLIKANNIEILNIAGNRGTKLSAVQRSSVGLTLVTAFKSK